MLQFTPVSAQDAELLRELHHFRGVDLHQLMKMMLAGQVFAAFRSASDPSFTERAQWLWLRDTFIDPGGKTLTAL